MRILLENKTVQVNTKGPASRQTCPDCGQVMELHRMESQRYDILGPPDSIWLACGRCQVAWEATLEVVVLRRIE